MLEIRGSGESDKSADDDHDWLSEVTLEVGPHPELSETQAKVYRLHTGVRGGLEGNKMTQDIKVCSNCVMDTTDSAIVFDDRGVCDHCNTFYDKIAPNWDTGEKGRAELDRMIETIQAEGKGKDFDCIIGMSGGIDSSYLVYAAKELMGLRPLVFHVDAGWNSQRLS